MKTFFLISFGVTMLSLSVFASEYDKSMKVQPQFSDIVRKVPYTISYCTDIDRHLEFCFMTQRKAEEYCKKQGGHLPTALELAQRAVAFGTKFITALEWQEYGRTHVSLYLVGNMTKILELDGTPASGFYFDSREFHLPEEFKEDRYGMLWSSNVSSRWDFNLSDPSKNWGITWDGYTGDFSTIQPSQVDATEPAFLVRCVIGR